MKKSYSSLAFVLALSATATTAATLTVTTIDNASGPADGLTSFDEALRSAADGDSIHFNIPGAGPHVIVTPIGGYAPITVHDLTIDGYSQPGSSPNTKAILEGNNAVLKIVLDSSGPETGENPGDPSLPLHRSTRLLYPGFGDTEDAILPVVGARNFSVRGISFVSRYAQDESFDPNVYCVAFVNVPTGATNGHVSGCWFGLRPDGTSVRGGRASVATFKNGTEDASGLVIGTDGDGVSDRAEFNIHAAMSLAIHLEVPNVRVSGNYVNVLPSGTNFVDIDAVAREIGSAQDPGNPNADPATVEFLENANCQNVLIGVNGDGIADADERNVVANVNYSETMEFWRAADAVVVAGNYFGVGVDGVTPSPVASYEQPDFLRFGRTASSVRIGSNGDGISDDLEANLLVNVSGDRFINLSQGGAGDINEIAMRRTTFRNCGFAAVPFADAVTPTVNYYLAVVENSAIVTPVLSRLAGGVVSGTFAAQSASYPFAAIDLYVADPVALARTNYWPSPQIHPSRWLGSLVDNGPADLDPALNKFSFDVSAAGLADDAYLTAAVTYSTTPATEAGTSVTSPMSNPVSLRPILAIAQPGPFSLELSWLGPPDGYDAQATEDFGGWSPVIMDSLQHVHGRNILTVAQDAFVAGMFFRLISR